MFKRILCVFCSVVMVFSMISPAVYADDEIMNHEHNWVDVPVSLKGEVFGMEYQVSIKHCTICNLYDHTISLAGYSYEYFAMTAAPGVEGVIQNLAIKLYCSIFGENATATKFTPGGGSTSGGGVGRPKGYADDNGTPNYNNNGAFQVVIWPDIAIKSSSNPFNSYPYSFNFTENNYYVTGNNNSILYNYTASSNGYYLSTYLRYSLKCKVNGLYYVENGQEAMSHIYNYNTKEFFSSDIWPNAFSKKLSAGSETVLLIREVSTSVMSSYKKYTAIVHPLVVTCIPDTITINNYNTITINNNTWNGNIYTDNSTNLTYIYPQYTTVNEKNETVTNISNTPIIYNNETKKYYTYDNVTNNYYYISYEPQATPTPSPSPTPSPTEKPGGSISTPETGKPGGDTGDTTGILAVLVEIRDNMIQGFLDIKAAFVAGFAELSANFTLAIENLNLNITNIFNKKFPDQSTPETAPPSPSPSPSPSPAPTDPPSPSPAPDPGKPDSGDKTNNFWTIIFPNGGGSEDGKKGIFWALVSLILALIAFFANLAVGVGYLFPFLPDGVVMTINTCLIVIFLFTIIKFIMRSK